MLLDLIELASNRTLAHDQAAQDRLARLIGKTMVLTVKPMQQSLAVTPQQEGVEFAVEIPETVDVKLSATLGALIKISRDGLENAELSPGELEIEGDPIIGQRFALLIAELDIDWESLLTEQVGAAPSKLILYAAEQARDFATTTREHLKIIVSRLLKDELKLVADGREVEAVLDEIDQLRGKTDRLDARLRRLVSQAG
ncbi:MAG: SCP2 sterol-binding domain-containing protein [Pseudomonadota bacterium]